MRLIAFQLLCNLACEEAKAIKRKGQCKLSRYILKELEGHLIAMLEIVREMRDYDEDMRQE